MTDVRQMDQAFDFVMQSFVRRGTAPGHGEIAARFGVHPDEAKRLLRELVDTKAMPMWLDADTQSITSFAPFSNFPTPYRITVDGHQKWFGQ